MEQPYILAILYCQWYACWCPGDLRSQGNSRHGIDQISQNIPSLASEELKRLWEQVNGCKLKSVTSWTLENKAISFGHRFCLSGLIPVNFAQITVAIQQDSSKKLGTTVETLYSTIYHSKYFIELNFDKSSQYVVLWTHKRHSIPRPFGRAMECLLWVLQQKLTVL